MEKQIIMYDGSVIAKYTETEEKKQMLWDAFIAWCQEHNASCGDSYQNDDFQIEAPTFIANAIDKIVQFKTEDVA